MQRNYISVCFSKNDKELIAWANMLRENNQSIGTWVQALLIAEDLNIELDAGSVSKNQERKSAQLSLLYGTSDETTNGQKTGWQIRGPQGEIIEGSILSIQITRPATSALLQKLRRNHKRVGPYIKAVLRKRIEVTETEPNRPPDKTILRDFFALNEHRYSLNQNPQNRGNQDQLRPHQKKKKGNNQPQKKTPEQKPTQKSNQIQKPEENQSPKQHKPTPPQPTQKEEEPIDQVKLINTAPSGEDAQPHTKRKRRNPLLGYID